MPPAAASEPLRRPALLGIGCALTWLVAIGWQALPWLTTLSTLAVAIVSPPAAAWLGVTIEIAMWAFAAATTAVLGVRVYGGSRPGTAIATLGAATAMALTAATVNWSLAHPQSYFAVHKWRFDQVATMAERGSSAELRSTTASGCRPIWLRCRSTDA